MIPVHLVSLGCARNDVDSEELAARLAAEGFTLVGEPEDAVVIVVNTCGFIEPAKKDSIDTLLAAADLKFCCLFLKIYRQFCVFYIEDRKSVV